MIRTPLAAALLFAQLLVAPALHAQSSKPQYISDEISVSIRERPSNDAPSLGTIKSGMRVTVLETLGPDSFTRIKTTDGREGWITSRFVSPEPAAKDQLLQLRKDLGEANSRAQSLQSELDAAKLQLQKAAPAFELAGENEKLRAAMAEAERGAAELRGRYDEESQRRKTLVAGAALVGGGILLGLILPWLGRGKKRRYSDF